jgi:hypothetical protein
MEDPGFWFYTTDEQWPILEAMVNDYMAEITAAGTMGLQIPPINPDGGNAGGEGADGNGNGGGTEGQPGEPQPGDPDYVDETDPDDAA